MTDGSPARIDRAALERIIQRAAELQTAERDIGEQLTPEQVLALGREVGIPGRYLQQALLEERTRLATAVPPGALGRLAGPTQAMAQRVVRGSVERLSDELVDWLETNELFCVQRRQTGRITWEPLGGVAAAVRRSTAAFGRGARSFMLSRADTVSATLVPLDDGMTHISLTAEARRARAGLVGGGAALAGAGLVGAGLMVALGALLPVALLPVPIALGAGYGLARQYGPVLQRLQLGLERALDQLERLPATHERQLPGRGPGLIGMLAEEIRRTMR